MVKIASIKMTGLKDSVRVPTLLVLDFLVFDGNSYIKQLTKAWHKIR